ncbi:3-oxoacyl-[acyl-carrier protein] reductase [Gracilibacillus boraciitolerans JCM 21714]|uniref:3-oxoacyl-[acyl-carrier protein] reductase n=1 Tax=Gracilibacillus boraciitolerans JCM 21714 TaxID=1298598 RepID=W4VEV1_9BACI|nr:SDR family NAD(P)-dependent oxidoreductase [Gracilibacillus boraciitolerans]GAE91289.1 3-oxoacyl-[acyl-carrier protein] reductase [Gracilibacillus boraciitolerans JCM 21714]
MSKLKGKFVLITGASSGIGKSLSFQVAAHQAIPILIARSEEKLVSISKKIEQEYQIKALYYAVDITDQERWGSYIAGNTISCSSNRCSDQ